MEDSSGLARNGGRAENGAGRERPRPNQVDAPRFGWRPEDELVFYDENDTEMGPSEFAELLSNTSEEEIQRNGLWARELREQVERGATYAEAEASANALLASIAAGERGLPGGDGGAEPAPRPALDPPYGLGAP